jgi:hypothetical protein
MYHPFRHRGKPILLDTTQNTDEFQDVRMGYRIPEDNLFAELLGDNLSVIPPAAKTSSPPTFLILLKSSVNATLSVFTATVHPLYFPGLISAKPPDV